MITLYPFCKALKINFHDSQKPEIFTKRKICTSLSYFATGLSYALSVLFYQICSSQVPLKYKLTSLFLKFDSQN